jgi:type II secretion system protein I
MNPFGRIRRFCTVRGRWPLGRGRRSARVSGYSLLEVIFALAIFAGALAVLGESARQAIRNATVARDLTCAQLLCESKMAEIVAGGSVPQAVEQTAFDVSAYPSAEGWLYSIRVDPTEHEGLMAMRVTVARDDPTGTHPLELSLVRWMMDPQSAHSTASSDSAKSGAQAPQKVQSTNAMQPAMNRMQLPTSPSNGGSSPSKSAPATQDNNRRAGS